MQHVRSTFFLLQTAIAVFRSQQEVSSVPSGGYSVVVVSSTAGLQGLATNSVYSAASKIL